MIKIVPDKEGKLTQWDLNRKVIVTGYEGIAEVHFASPGDDHGAYVVELIDGQAEIPNILLTMAGTINVYVYPADRTVFATTLWVMAREKPDDYVYTETEVLSYKTLDEKIGDLAKLTTAAKENLVAAINEAATNGMASIYMRVADGYIEYSGDGVNWKQLIAVAELKGDKGDKGDPGAQGAPGAQGEKGDKGDKGDPGSDATVEIVTPTAESTDTQAASAKAVWDISGDLSTLKTTAKDNLVNALNEVHDSIGSGGSGGTDISLGLTGATVGDIVKVKAVDASGKPTAWEAAAQAESEVAQVYETLFEVEEAVESVEYDFTDEKGNPIMLKEVEIVQHFISTNKSGADTTIKVLFEDDSTSYLNIANNYANAAGNWILAVSVAKVLGKTVYVISTKNTSTNGSMNYLGSISKIGAAAVGGWGDRWAQNPKIIKGIIGMKIPGAVGAKGQFYVYGVKA